MEPYKYILRAAARRIFQATRRNTYHCIVICSFITTIMILKESNKRSVILFKKIDLIESQFQNDQMYEDEMKVRKIQMFDSFENAQRLENITTPGSCLNAPSILVGNMTVNTKLEVSFDEVKKQAGTDLRNGGCYTPKECKPIQKVAIVIPFKDRETHLKILLYYLHPMLMRQRSQYCIFVSEQFDTGQFNKAMVMNAAFIEIMKLDSYDCIVFHDVDMLPENDENIYGCGTQPRHLSPAIDKFEYKPHYGTDFGGVTAITPDQYRKANGHSNQYWGWGGEDNDMEFRIRYNGMKIQAPPLDIGRYKMIVHQHAWKFKPGEFPYYLNETKQERAKSDGLSDISYKLVDTYLFPTYTKFMFDIRRIEVKTVTMFVDGKTAMKLDFTSKSACKYERYEEKYLEMQIELTDVKEAKPFAPDVKTFEERSNEEKEEKNKKVRFATVQNYEDAVMLCETLQPHCKGLQKSVNGKYSLKKSDFPRNVIGIVSRSVSPLGGGKYLSEVRGQKRYFFDKALVAFVRHCPGEASSMHKYQQPLKVDLDVEQPKIQHQYSFEIHFDIISPPTSQIYYVDSKVLDNQLFLGEEISYLTWPNGKDIDNFSPPSPSKTIVIRTKNHTFSDIPGCYGVESKIVNRNLNPYFEWNWWYEVVSDDKIRDVEVKLEVIKKIPFARSKMLEKKTTIFKNRKEEIRLYLKQKENAKRQGKSLVLNPQLEKLLNTPMNVIEAFIINENLATIQHFPEVFRKKIDEKEQKTELKDDFHERKGFHLGPHPPKNH